jgi:hypothetical protein
MPSVAKIGPYRFFFFANENAEPAHVHVERDDATAKFWLDVVELADADGFKAHELAKIEEIVQARRGQFLEKWHAFFGR